MTNQKISFAIEKLDIINDGQDSEFATLSILAFADGRNLHNTYVSNETLRRTAPTIREKPLVWEFDKRFQDASGHEETEVPCGFIPANSPLEFVDAEDGSGRTFLKIVGRVWKRYSGRILEFFARDDMSKSVSVEIDPLDVVENIELGVPEIKDYIYNCITILGDLISPAVKGARADIIAFAVKEKEEYLQVYQKEFSKYDELNLEIPEKMKQNMQDGLDLWAELDGEESAKTISLAVARYVTKNSQFTIEKFRQLQKYVPKTFKGNDLNSLLWGSFEGQQYFKDISEKLAEIDSKRSSYFSEDDMKNDFSKDDWGKGAALKVDKKKESLSENSWGDVDKTSLRNKILGASNYKSLVDDVYMLVESGWEDSPSSKLKYPVMELRGDTFVYNRYGLSAALQRAEGQNETSVLSKINTIYSKMGLDKSKNSDNKFEKKEDTTKMTDKTEEKEFADEVVDTEMAKPVEESPAEEKKESPAEEKKEDMAAPVDDKSDDNTGEDKTYMSVDTEDVDMAKPIEKDDVSDKSDEDNTYSYKYSNNAYVDVMAALGFLQSQTETNNEMADEYKNSIQMAVAEMSKNDQEFDFAKVCAGLYAYAQMCNSEMSKMSVEMASLKEFKASEDSKAFNYTVNSTMAEVKDVLPENDYAEMIEESKKYSVDNITGWQNLVRAKALPFALKIKPKNEELPVKKYGLIFDNITAPKKKTNFVWDN